MLRYNRQIILSEIGIEGQTLLNNAKVLVVGAGGLGCPVLQYIAAAGVGTIGVIDNDVIDISNLQRQILFKNEDLGKSKAITAQKSLQAQNPDISVISYNEALNIENANSIISQYDLVIDGTDNFATRYLVNDTCVILNKPFIAASILQFEGQISVYNYQKGPTYRCLFPEPPQDALTCSEAGVLGVLGGVMGSLQANEAIKIITKIGEVLSGKLFVINLLTLQNYTLSFERSEHWNQINEKDYELICSNEVVVNEILPLDLKKQLENFQIIDIRKPDEFKRFNIGGINIKIEDVIPELENCDTTKPLVICCNHGINSLSIVKQIVNLNFANKIYSLKGGIVAYSSL